MPDPGFNQPDPYATALTDAQLAAPITAAEMATAVDEATSALEQSVRAAMTVYAVAPHPFRMRQIAAMQKAVDLIRRVDANRAKVAPILYADEIAEAKRERAYQAKRAREQDT